MDMACDPMRCVCNWQGKTGQARRIRAPRHRSPRGAVRGMTAILFSAVLLVEFLSKEKLAISIEHFSEFVGVELGKLSLTLWLWHLYESSTKGAIDFASLTVLFRYL